jgi:hypothetical protein
MSEKVTIELPDELARRAKAIAAASRRRLEDAVIEWIRRAVAEPDVKTLPDDEVLRLCDATLEPTIKRDWAACSPTPANASSMPWVRRGSTT